MKKTITTLACASLLALTLSTATFGVNAQTTPQFDRPAAAAPKPVKKKVQAKPRAKAKAQAKAKASGKASARKKARKTKKANAL